MEMLPQPPAGVSPPPPDHAAKRSWSWLALIVIGGVASLAVLNAAFGVVKSRHGKGHEISRTVSNLRQMGLALFEFESEYGRIPSPATVQEVKEETGTTWRLDDRTSNGLLKQLMVTGMVSSEEIFWCKGVGGKRPDNSFATESDALAKGECGFAYIVCDSITAPRLMGPVVRGTTRFDPKSLDAHGVVLHGDNSISGFSINRSGEAIDATGKNLLDPSHPHWSGKPFEVFYPE